MIDILMEITVTIVFYLLSIWGKLLASCGIIQKFFLTHILKMYNKPVGHQSRRK